jgi:signal transduction histidine kinase
MNGILGFADLLKEPGLTEKCSKNTSLYNRSGVQNANIINDIVDISKIEAGLMEVNVQQVNINKQIDSSILSSNLKLGKKDCIV